MHVRVCNANDDIGRVCAVNQGAASATGEWLIFLEKDVLPQSRWLETLLNAASGQPTPGALPRNIKVV